MSGKNDLVVKMTINSKDFDAGLKNAKASMNRFGQSAISAKGVLDNVVKGMIKSFGALGVAVTGAQLFKSFINSTQTIGDKWENAMVTAKTSFESFQVAVMTGSSSILSNFRQSIAAANEFASAMDRLGSAQISNQYARMSYVTPFNEELTKYRNAKQQKDSTGMAFAASNMQRYLTAYQENSLKILSASQDALASRLSSYTGGFVNRDNLSKYLDQLYLEIVNDVFPPILQDFKNLDKELEKGDYFYNQAKAEMEKRYGPGWRREAEAMNALSNINDDALKEMLEVIKTYDNVRNEINSMRRQMNKALNGDATTATTTTTTASEALTWEQQQEMMIRQMQRVPITNNTIIPLEELIEFEEIIEEDTDKLVETVQQSIKATEGLTLATESLIGTMAGAFNKLSDLFGGDDTVVGQIFGKLGDMAGFAGNLYSVYKIVGPLLGLPAFASGGVVPGTSYSGDKLLARVNSGEMILNRQQQAALFSGGNGGGTVKFVIEGSQLKGVLNNYESIEAM